MLVACNGTENGICVVLLSHASSMALLRRIHDRTPRKSCGTRCLELLVARGCHVLQVTFPLRLYVKWRIVSHTGFGNTTVHWNTFSSGRDNYWRVVAITGLIHLVWLLLVKNRGVSATELSSIFAEAVMRASGFKDTTRQSCLSDIALLNVCIPSVSG